MKIEIRGEGTNPFPESWYLEMVNDAKAQVQSFFKLYGVLQPLKDIQRVSVFTREGMLRDYCCEIFNRESDQLPHYLAGGLHEDELFLLTPNLYRELVFEPQCAMLTNWEVHHYCKLIGHELAHRIHENHCLDTFSSTEAMGPVWFFEGLACFSARQYYFLYEDYKRDAGLLLKRLEDVHTYVDTDFQYAEFYKLVEGLERFLDFREILHTDWSKQDLQQWVTKNLCELT